MLLVFSVITMTTLPRDTNAQIVSCDGPSFHFVTPASATTVINTNTGAEQNVVISVKLELRCFDGSVTFTPSASTPTGLTCTNLPSKQFVSESDQFPTVTVTASCSAPNPGDYAFTVRVNATTSIGSGSSRAPCSSPDILLPSGYCEELQTSPSITAHVTASVDAIPFPAVIAAVALLVAIMAAMTRRRDNPSLTP